MIEHGFVVKTMEHKIKGFVSKNSPGDSDSVTEDEPEYKP